MKKIINLALLAMLVSAPSMASHFDKLDTDKDGYISQSEAKGPLKRGFARLDLNSDGKISQSEIEQLRQKRPAKS